MTRQTLFIFGCRRPSHGPFKEVCTPDEVCVFLMDEGRAKRGELSSRPLVFTSRLVSARFSLMIHLLYIVIVSDGLNGLTTKVPQSWSHKSIAILRDKLYSSCRW